VHVIPVQLAGGIGLFLLGMILMTDGVKSFAGDALRQALMRFTGRPLRAFFSGLLVTMVVQSSSATTVTVIGFVSAGLLTFSQAICLVIGASLGTTGTSWMVSVLGLKFSLGLYSLPLIAVGAIVRLVARGNWKFAGLALAGFGLIFLGIATLQEGMEGISAEFQIASRPGGSLLDHLLLMLTGAALTVIMQSSSAAMATILTALHTNSINFEQAASLVIGAAIGTTITSVLAAIGANVSAKRTALAHVVFNLVTGLIAILLLPLFLKGIAVMQQFFGVPPGAVSLAAFHTAFISLGVILFLPLVRPFSRWIERLLPETGPQLTRHLDNSVLNVPEVALEATRRALSETTAELFDVARRRLRDKTRDDLEIGLPYVHGALEQIQSFLSHIPPLAEDRPMSRSRVAQMHAIDHMLRLEASLHPPRAVLDALSDPSLEEALVKTCEILALASAGFWGQTASDWEELVRKKSEELAATRRRERPVVLQQTAIGQATPHRALIQLDTMRWMDRISYHTSRICHYLHTDRSEVSA
jgi:phosphate:Na+ symporter